VSTVAIIGAGAGGAAAVVELTLAGHEVRWWNRNATTIAPFREAGGVTYEGILGEGALRPARFADALEAAQGRMKKKVLGAEEALKGGVKRIVMCVPAPHGELSPYLLVAADIAGVDEIYAQALKEGMTTMRRDGMVKVKEGVTTPFEVLRSVYSLNR